MAHCVMSTVNDEDLREIHSCVVHTTYGPCPHDGEPASPAPLHGDTVNGRAELIALWVDRTDKQRPLHIHRGDWLDGTHQIGVDGVCWCRPEILGPRDEQ